MEWGGGGVVRVDGCGGGGGAQGEGGWGGEGGVGRGGGDFVGWRQCLVGPSYDTHTHTNAHTHINTSSLLTHVTLVENHLCIEGSRSHSIHSSRKPDGNHWFTISPLSH